MQPTLVKVYKLLRNLSMAMLLRLSAHVVRNVDTCVEDL
ncbi:hypothetical protein PAMC26577_40585 [Caballeronia sordidicola]|uniref:Uncharacterized protein n=1 Tax=Caballeronia sordidicola TaxID=196367 RepID=A0A242M411_CABSO|nr:hypothetical protein PAMC26577_40585 [Caballeronia sordidicola]